MSKMMRCLIVEMAILLAAVELIINSPICTEPPPWQAHAVLVLVILGLLYLVWSLEDEYGQPR